MQILDRLVGQAAQLLGLAGALAQDRHQRLGALQQLREIRRPAGPAKLWATLFRLGHHEPSFPRRAAAIRPIGDPTLPAAQTRGEIVDNVGAWRQGCSRRAADALFRAGGANDLHGRDGFPASRAPPGMARLVSRPYPRAADGTRLPCLAALRGGRRDPLALSRAARGGIGRTVRQRRLPLTRRPGLDRRMAAIANQLAPQPARRARRDA